MKKLFGTLMVVLGLMFVSAQTPQLPLPQALPADPSTEEMRSALIASQGSLCQGIDYAANILTKTGTLGQAIPVVMDMTGLQPADIEAKEAEACRSDLSELTLEQLRANNQIAVWLLEVHMSAMDKVIAQ
ncbi:MAG: hypothetical protein KC422_18300 [Trueperaceae bacterium]|nr:hypothetical protein [Trueperaceae bacterium]